MSASVPSLYVHPGDSIWDNYEILDFKEDKEGNLLGVKFRKLRDDEIDKASIKLLRIPITTEYLDNIVTDTSKGEAPLGYVTVYASLPFVNRFKRGIERDNAAKKVDKELRTIIDADKQIKSGDVGTTEYFKPKSRVGEADLKWLKEVFASKLDDKQKVNLQNYIKAYQNYRDKKQSPEEYTKILDNTFQNLQNL